VETIENVGAKLDGKIDDVFVSLVFPLSGKDIEFRLDDGRSVGSLV
jgi:hypothetical protein